MTPEKVVFIKGERMYFRPLEKEDLPRMQRWVNDPLIRPFIGNQWPMDAAAETEWFEKRDRGVPRSEIILAIVLNEGDRHIGNMGLHQIDWRNRSATTGAIIGERDCWGKKYGHESKELLLEYAFNTLGLHRINSLVLETNRRSYNCLISCGYREEGRRRHAMLVDGEWIDDVVMGILDKDWRERRKEVTGREERYRRTYENQTPITDGMEVLKLLITDLYDRRPLVSRLVSETVRKGRYGEYHREWYVWRSLHGTGWGPDDVPYETKYFLVATELGERLVKNGSVYPDGELHGGYYCISSFAERSAEKRMFEERAAAEAAKKSGGDPPKDPEPGRH